MKPYLPVFLSVLLAELGDKTQMATLLFATDATLSRWGVLVAAAGALVISTILAVVVGAAVGDWLPPRLLGRLAAVGFIAIGVWMLIRG
jgi:putative Ca2+/H+ antiporter (TMEM165/GDT1 family)